MERVLQWHLLKRWDLAFICSKDFRKIYFFLKLRNFYMVLLYRTQHAEKKKFKRNFLDILQTLTHSSRHKVYFYVSPANYCAKDSSSFWKKTSIVCLFLVYEKSWKICRSFEWCTVKITEKLKFSIESSSLYA